MPLRQAPSKRSGQNEARSFHAPPPAAGHRQPPARHGTATGPGVRGLNRQPPPAAGVIEHRPAPGGRARRPGLARKLARQDGIRLHRSRSLPTCVRWCRSRARPRWRRTARTRGPVAKFFTFLRDATTTAMTARPRTRQTTATGAHCGGRPPGPTAGLAPLSRRLTPSPPAVDVGRRRIPGRAQRGHPLSAARAPLTFEIGLRA
jgi:hypothetical protein